MSTLLALIFSAGIGGDIVRIYHNIYYLFVDIENLANRYSTNDNDSSGQVDREKHYDDECMIYYKKGDCNDEQ